MSNIHDKPTDYTIVLVAFLLGREWLTADEIRLGIEKLGFAAPSRQWVLARLTRMCKEECPPFMRQWMAGWADALYEYRLTGWATIGLGNQWSGFRPWTVLLPTPKPEERI